MNSWSVSYGGLIGRKVKRWRAHFLYGGRYATRSQGTELSANLWFCSDAVRAQIINHRVFLGVRASSYIDNAERR